ncbi:hypothetical protein AAC387_Pa04g2824 [Persea americana]
MKAVYGEAARHERECETSEAAPETSTKKTRNAASTSDGASIEVARRPRGRPPGSKNKPKPPLVITRETTESSSLHPHILQVPGGLDVVDAITRFARRRNTGLCILTGTGTVANVTLRHPTSPTTVCFHGRFEILSISATFLPPSSSSPSLSSLPHGFTVSLVGAQGQIVGGSVAGSLLAAGTVVIVAAGFVNPSFHRLVGEDEFSASGVSLSGSEIKTHHHQQQEEEDEEEQQHHQGHDHDHHHLMDSSGGGMSVYNCHLPSDVIWAPIARPPPPF